MASRPALDAWYGARDWALEHLPGAGGGGSTEGWISRQDYEEKGGEYLSEHSACNVFVPLKIAKPAPARPAEAAVTAVADASPAPVVATTTASVPSVTTFTSGPAVSDAAMATLGMGR